MAPFVMDAWETKVMQEACGARGPNWGRTMMGSIVGIDAFGSPYEVLEM